MTKKSDKIVKAGDVIVDAPALARICRLNVRTIHKLAEQGIIVRVSPGRFDQWSSIGNLLEHYREQASGRIGRDKNVDAVRANCELKNSQRRLNELRIAKMEGSLISIPEVDAAWTEIALSIRQLFMSLPARARFDLPYLTGQDQEALDTLVRQMLTEVATEGCVHIPSAAENA